MKKGLVLFLLAILIIALPVSAQNDELIIFHTNDVHGHIVQDLSEPSFGIARVAQEKQDALDAGYSVLLFSAGDDSQGMPIVNLSKGETAIEAMNLAGYDAMVPGNHEFDWGADNALQLADKAEFPWIASNITRESDGTHLFNECITFDMPNGMKIGVFGLDTPEVKTKANPELVKGIEFGINQDIFAIAQAEVDELTAEGCDLIIMLSHLGVDDESIGYRSVDVADNTTGIDLIIDGHSHTEIAEVFGETLIVSTGSYGHNLGKVVFDGETLTASLIPAVYEDAEVAEYVNTLNDEIQEQLSAVFAQTTVDLNGERAPGVRTEETNLGDFAADALLWEAKQMVGEEVVAAVTNGGGIRATIKAGDITMNDMKTVFPYGNVVTVLTVTGAELLEALEAATFALPEPLGAFPQIAGMEITVDTAVPYEQGDPYPDSTYFAPAKPGARVTINSIGGEPFDAEKAYIIATNDFTAVGGDTYYAFKYPYTQSGYKTGVSLESALIDYVAEVLGGTVGEPYDKPQGRIVIK